LSSLPTLFRSRGLNGATNREKEKIGAEWGRRKEIMSLHETSFWYGTNRAAFLYHQIVAPKKSGKKENPGGEKRKAGRQWPFEFSSDRAWIIERRKAKREGRPEQKEKTKKKKKKKTSPNKKKKKKKTTQKKTNKKKVKLKGD